MQYEAKNVEDYIRQLPGDRKKPIEKTRQILTHFESMPNIISE